MSEALPDYSAFEQKPQVVDLELLSGLAGRLLDANQAVEQAEAALKELKAKAQELSWNQIPELMERLGMKKFTLTDGSEISVAQDIRVKLPKDPEKRAKVLGWINENGGAELMKRCFEISFDRGDEKWAEKFERDCKQRKKPLDIARLESIHPGTFKKFLTDKLERGEVVPLEDLGAFRQMVAKVK